MDKKYGYTGLINIIIATMLLPFLMLKDTSLSVLNIIKSLYLSKSWKYISANDQRNAFNNLFYYIQDFNIRTFGRYGTSDFLAGGKFNLKNLFHLTPLSLRIQSFFGTTFIMFFAMLFWSFSWFILYDDNVVLLLAVTFFSTIFFVPFIEIQNYNILGWMLYPIYLFYLIHTNYYMLGIVVFLLASLSFTGFFISGLLAFVAIVYTQDFYIVFVFIPAFIKSGYPFFRTITNDREFLNKLQGILGSHDKVKYDRSIHKKIHFPKKYMFVLFTQFLFVYVAINGMNNESMLLVIVVVLFILNSTLIRFADHQTFYILYLSVAIFSLLELDDIPTVLWISYALSIYQVYKNILGTMPFSGDISPGIRTPYDISNDIEKLNEIFSLIPRNSEVLIAYKNPKNRYDNIFNGYRVFNEPIQYVANLNQLNAYPDWYFIMQHNKSDSRENFWIENETEALNYMRQHNIRYVIASTQYEEFNSGDFIKLGSYDFCLIETLKKFNNRYGIQVYQLKEKIDVDTARKS